MVVDLKYLKSNLSTFTASSHFSENQVCLCLPTRISFPNSKCFRVWILPIGGYGKLSSSYHLCDFFIWICWLLLFQDCCLILYHPYRPLLQYARDIDPDDSLLQMAWLVSFFLLIICNKMVLHLDSASSGTELILRYSSYDCCHSCIFRRIVNDSLRTDVSLLYPPYMISLGESDISFFVNWSVSQIICTDFFLASLLQLLCMWLVLFSRKKPSNGLLNSTLTWTRF